jgi:hypothetical protein
MANPKKNQPKRKPSSEPPKATARNRDGTNMAAMLGLPVAYDGQYYVDYFPVEDGDTYYRGNLCPLEMLLRFAHDERNGLKDRIAVAEKCLPYMVSKAAPRPYMPSEEERRRIEDDRRLIVEIVDFHEVED